MPAKITVGFEYPNQFLPAWMDEVLELIEEIKDAFHEFPQDFLKSVEISTTTLRDREGLSVIFFKVTVDLRKLNADQVYGEKTLVLYFGENDFDLSKDGGQHRVGLRNYDSFDLSHLVGIAQDEQKILVRRALMRFWLSSWLEELGFTIPCQSLKDLAYTMGGKPGPDETIENLVEKFAASPGDEDTERPGPTITYSKDP